MVGSVISFLGGWKGYAVAAAVAALAAWWVTDSINGEEIQRQKTLVATEQKGRADDVAKWEKDRADKQELARVREQEMQDAIDRLQAEFAKRRQDDEKAMARLRADFSGKLRIAGTCPGGFGSAAANSSADGGGNETQIRLSEKSERIAFDMIAGMVQDQTTLEACQAYSCKVYNIARKMSPLGAEPSPFCSE